MGPLRQAQGPGSVWSAWASEAKGPSSQREEGWELGESKSKRVEIQPTHRSGMGLGSFLQGEGGEVVGRKPAD